MEKISLFLKQFGLFGGIGIVGIAILTYGLWGVIKPQQATVEIIKESDSQDTNDQIIVDLSGEVEKPGVYKLSGGSRVGDALVVAGGLSLEADREWVAQTLNLASEIKDGEKIYIPSKQEKTKESTLQQTNVTTKSQGKININTASLAELDGLPGIGEVRAGTILDNRPYSRIDDLVSKAKIPQSVYEKIKDQISVY